ncbi:hypothetical protein COCMIDRAFT_79279 [Bipolaris oryzae ATCC 44560]|uniref:Uncharacterized protein n=1 Tax=Bipolaris oryzae ATCC 44560 TaxID=930090 RepID=W6ZMR3_COCMI|nr:uncharacterized protein COCMIDRAFT_79279 [Bipolaris oryzae ATCC 44560]EUC51395.1 hypothetical protein COCMIDRAFT_79279 [Bipolaris oryzae ATCC 44560]
MSDVVSRELVLGADVSSDNSSDQDWEDNFRNMMQTFTLDRTDWIEQREGRKRNSIASLSNSAKAPIRSPESGIKDDEKNVECVAGFFENEERGPKRARRISLLRLNKDTVRLIQNSPSIDSSTHSIKSNYFDCVSSNGDKGKSCLHITSNDREDSCTLLPLSPTSQNYHRRTVSENMIADSTINAHMATMHVLEPRNLDLSPVASRGFTYLQSATTSEFPRSSSCPSSCRTTLLSLLSTNGDRLVYVPSRFSETQHPFTAKKKHRKFKPHTRRSCSYPSVDNRGVEEYAKLNNIHLNREAHKTFGDCKSKCILGLVASEEELLQRSGLERNIRSQGLTGSNIEFGSASAESVIWLSLRKYGRMKNDGDGRRRKMVRFVVPNVSSPHNSSYPEKPRMLMGEATSFDDKRFAEDLQAGHRKLAGSWFLKIFRAHRLCAVRLNQTSVWSGTQTPTTTEELLAVGDGICTSEEIRHPLAEEGLMKLLKKPQMGQERYMWVHWVRRVAASNSRVQTDPYVRDSSRLPPPTITILEFLHTPCKFRILMALALCLLGCITAALVWIFMSFNKMGMKGDAGEQSSKHMGNGVGIGMLVLLLEGVWFWTWIAFS